jgi:hypothetical protein
MKDNTIAAACQADYRFRPLFSAAVGNRKQQGRYPLLLNGAVPFYAARGAALRNAISRTDSAMIPAQAAVRVSMLISKPIR